MEKKYPAYKGYAKIKKSADGKTEDIFEVVLWKYEPRQKVEEKNE